MPTMATQTPYDALAALVTARRQEAGPGRPTPRGGRRQTGRCGSTFLMWGEEDGNLSTDSIVCPDGRVIDQKTAWAMQHAMQDGEPWEDLATVKALP